MLAVMAERMFADRAQAGHVLGAHLAGLALADPVVLGLPRGGVVVAAHAAAELDRAAEVFVARKIGHPRQPEYGLGALAEGGEPVYDRAAMSRLGLQPGDLTTVVEAERAELARRVQLYRGSRPFPALAGRTVVLVDDGIATGVTARAALHALRGHGPERLLLAAPVGAEASLRDLVGDADEFVVLERPARFGAVGRWYAEFGQVSDDTVLRLLATPPGRRSR
jgi:putative phosphoribosyl transferase